MRHRLLSCLVLACLAPCAGGASALAADPTARPLTFDVQVGPDDATACRITATLHLPAGADAAHPVPVILATNGFGGSKADFDVIGPAYARRDFALLAYSGLGFGGSGCKIHLDDPDWDGKAGSQLITWLGRQDFVVKDAPGDPRVGMIGGSYGGAIQFAVASVDRRLDTIIPQITWNDLDYALAGNNTDFASGVSSRSAGVAKLDWPLLFSAAGVGSGLSQMLQTGDLSHLGACPNFADAVCTALVQSAVRGHTDEATRAFLRHASVASYVAKVRIPTFLSQGLNDTLFNVQEAIATWTSLRAQNTPVKMMWRTQGHSGGGGTFEQVPASPEQAYESRAELEWMQYYLKGIGEAPKLDVSFFRDWVAYEGDGAPAVGVTRSFPVGTDRTFGLSGSDGLTTGVPVAGSAQLVTVPVPGGTAGGLVGSGSDEVPGTFVAFSTGPLTEDLEVGGPSRLRLAIDAPVHAATQAIDPATHLVLFARLEDVAPDGTPSIPAGIVSAVRVADVTKPLDVELPAIVHRFAQGHRLRVVVSQGTLLRRGNTIAGPVTVSTGPQSGSQLTVPVLGAAGARGSAQGGMTPIASPAGSPESQPAGLGGPARPGAAAGLPSSRKCVSRRSFRITLARGRRGDRVVSATVRVNGKQARVLRGKRLRAAIDLRGLPRGTVRVVITARTQKGRRLASARTYRTCVAGKKR